ncbi:MAG: hypothetical protein U0353_06005 [Sandaracinus sp.]
MSAKTKKKSASAPSSDTSSSSSTSSSSPTEPRAPRTATSPAPSAPSTPSTPAMPELDPWSRYWLAPIAAVRPWLLRKLILALLAFDVLYTLLGPAWRYGAAGFNVPHFAWMSVLAVPSTAAYVGMLFFVSTSALVCALVPRPPRPLLFAIAILYTWGWSSSMLDSYQHHYLLSFVLLAFALFPSLDARALFGSAATPREAPHGLVPRVHVLSYALLTSASGIVYLFTAISKTEPDWLSGDAMRSITHDGQTIGAALDLAASLGIEGDDFWWLLGHGVVPAQIVIFLTYLSAPLLDGPSTSEERDRLAALVGDLWAPGGRGPAITGGALVGTALGVVLGFALGYGAAGITLAAILLGLVGMVLFFDGATWRFALGPFGRPSPLRAFAVFGMLTAVSFHIGAEHLSLAIGWFSTYMILVAFVTLLPARWLSLAAFAITAPLRTRHIDWSSPLVLPRLVLATLAGGGGLVVMGQLADLPGAMNAALLLLVVLAAIVGGSFAGRLERADAMPFAAACAVASIALSAWVYVSPARFDYYRFAGGDFRRRLDYEHALHAYEHANRYAPPGESRDDRIEEMRGLVRSRRGLAQDEE